MKHQLACSSLLCRGGLLSIRPDVYQCHSQRSTYFWKQRLQARMSNHRMNSTSSAPPQSTEVRPIESVMRIRKVPQKERQDVNSLPVVLQPKVSPPKALEEKQSSEKASHRKDAELKAKGPCKVESARAIRENLFNKDGTCNMDPMYLRDACSCAQCVDISSGQRNFSFTQIPTHIKALLKEVDRDGVHHVSWEDDVPGFESSHISKFPASRIRSLALKRKIYPLSLMYDARHSRVARPLWGRAEFTSAGCWTDYSEYIKDEKSLKRTLAALHKDGLVFIKNVPPEPSSVAHIAERIGPLRNTFYGPTWDVRSVAKAKNVAYTSKYLGFHMDLLYMDSPPEYQLLHCIQNSCTGGESRFVDTFKAASILADKHPRDAMLLSNNYLRYTYDNDGHHYARTRPVFHLYPGLRGKEPGPASAIHRLLKCVNWSPEFLDKPSFFTKNKEDSEALINAAKRFAEILEKEDLVYQVKMEEGTCVIFENRRVAHARNAFEMQSGQRWLRGAYLDLDTFWSKIKVLGVQSARQAIG